jgi:RHS repeat-associated protein
LRTTAKRYAAPERIRQQYAGLERDDVTGLDHTWWRKYENRSGRWTSTDPLAGSIGNPQSLNRYAYVQNDPVNFSDPTGLFAYLGVVRRFNDPSGGAMLGAVTGSNRRKAPISEYELRRVGGGPQKPSPPPEPQDIVERNKKYAQEIANAVIAALDALKSGCYTEGASNPDVQPFSFQFAKIQNSDKYTGTWKNTVASHGGSGSKESPGLPGAAGSAFIVPYVVKYYPSDGNNPAVMAVTLETRSLAHAIDAVGFHSTDPFVNVERARAYIQLVPKCDKNKPH